jgi:hypothetical protein
MWMLKKWEYDRGCWIDLADVVHQWLGISWSVEEFYGGLSEMLCLVGGRRCSYVYKGNNVQNSENFKMLTSFE